MRLRVTKVHAKTRSMKKTNVWSMAQKRVPAVCMRMPRNRRYPALSHSFQVELTRGHSGSSPIASRNAEALKLPSKLAVAALDNRHLVHQPPHANSRLRKGKKKKGKKGIITPESSQVCRHRSPSLWSSNSCSSLSSLSATQTNVRCCDPRTARRSTSRPAYLGNKQTPG